MNINLKGKKILKAAGIIAILVGMIAAFGGFFVMLMNMTMVSPDEAVQQASNYDDIIGMYVIVYGMFVAVAGFVGVINSDNSDYIGKNFKYALIYLGLSIVNIIIMAVTANLLATLSLIITGIPLLSALLYMLGAFLNLKSVNDAQ